MVARYWLEEDNRERYYTARQTIDDYMLSKSYGAMENQLEMVVTIGSAMLSDWNGNFPKAYYPTNTSGEKIDPITGKPSTPEVDTTTDEVSPEDKPEVYLPGGYVKTAKKIAVWLCFDNGPSMTESTSGYLRSRGDYSKLFLNTFLSYLEVVSTDYDISCGMSTTAGFVKGMVKPAELKDSQGIVIREMWSDLISDRILLTNAMDILTANDAPTKVLIYMSDHENSSDASDRIEQFLDAGGSVWLALSYESLRLCDSQKTLDTIDIMNELFSARTTFEFDFYLTWETSDHLDVYVNRMLALADTKTSNLVYLDAGALSLSNPVEPAPVVADVLFTDYPSRYECDVDIYLENRNDDSISIVVKEPDLNEINSYKTTNYKEIISSNYVLSLLSLAYKVDKPYFTRVTYPRIAVGLGMADGTYEVYARLEKPRSANNYGFIVDVKLFGKTITLEAPTSTWNPAYVPEATLNSKPRLLVATLTKTGSTIVFEPFIPLKRELQLSSSETSTNQLKFADRPKYIGNTFYEGRIQSMPRSERAMPEVLDATVTLAESDVSLSNVDGALTKYLPGGSRYRPFIGEQVDIKIGLRNVEMSLVSIFSGNISKDNGLQFTKDTISFKFRDRLASLDNKVPLESITAEAFGSAPPEVIGKLIPLAFGKWSRGYAFIKAGYTQAQVMEENYEDVHNWAPAAGCSGGLPGWYVGGGYFLFHSGGRAGKTYFPENINDVRVKRGDAYMECNFSISPSIIGGHYCAWVSGLIRGAYDGIPEEIPYFYQSGDVAIISVDIPMGDNWDDNVDNNPIFQAQELLIALGRLSTEDFSTEWDDASVQLAGLGYLSRIWVGDKEKTTLGVISGLLKSFLYDVYVDQQLKVSLESMWTEMWPLPSAVRAHIAQYDIVEDSIQVNSEMTNYMTGAQANYAWCPWLESMMATTKKRKNPNAETKIMRSIVKEIDMPPVVDEAVALAILDRYVLFGSCGLIYLEMEVGWKHMLVDLGDMVTISCKLGSIDYDNVPAMVRRIGVLPKVTGISLTLLVFANFSYPGWTSTSESLNLSNYDTVLVDG